MRSQLANSAERLRLLNKIKDLYTEKASRLVFEIAGARFGAEECTNVALDFTLADDNIEFQRPGGLAVEYYDNADIIMVKRLRTKKYLIVLADAADEAEATP
jgi:hypothetical protein